NIILKVINYCIYSQSFYSNKKLWLRIKIVIIRPVVNPCAIEPGLPFCILHWDKHEITFGFHLLRSTIRGKGCLFLFTGKKQYNTSEDSGYGFHTMAFI